MYICIFYVQYPSENVSVFETCIFIFFFFGVGYVYAVDSVGNITLTIDVVSQLLNVIK